jgi:hypothetical protein
VCGGAALRGEPKLRQAGAHIYSYYASLSAELVGGAILLFPVQAGVYQWQAHPYPRELHQLQYAGDALLESKRSHIHCRPTVIELRHRSPRWVADFLRLRLPAALSND